MSTLGQLYALLGQNQIQPYAEGMRTVLGNERLETANQTDLLQLAELQRAQQQAQQERAFIAAHPELFLGQGQPAGPQSVLGGGGMPAPAPMTQQTLMPGQPPGAPQMVPGGQDLSRYAGVAPQGGGPIPPDVMRQTMPTVTPPMQSTLGAPGPQPAQAPDPLLELMRTNPDAALKVQGRLQAMQEKRLTNTITEAEYAGRILQGVTNQASYDEARREIGRNLPQLAAQLPPAYSVEAIEPFIARATDVKTRATLEVQGIQARAELQRARMSGRVATTDQYLKTLGVVPGQETAADMEKAIALQQRDEVARQAAHGTGQIVMTPGGAIRVGKDNQVEVIKGPDGKPIYDKPTAAAEGAASYGDRAKRANDNAVALENKGITPSLWAKVGNALPLGLGDYLVGEDQRDYQRAVNQFGGALLRKESGAVISQTEYNMIDRTFFPQPNDTKKQIEAKRQEREAVIKNLQEEGKAAGRTGTQGQPTSQGATRKPVGEMSREDIAAEIAAIKARGGR